MNIESEQIKNLTEGAENGDVDSQFNLGLLYDNGQGVEQDDKIAAIWYKKAAEQGHAKAQFYLGNMYEDGQGVPQNDEDAVYWYRRAAVQGYTDAQFNLALMYENGDGVQQNYKEAIQWLRKAAKQGDLDSLVSLGAIYCNGEGISKNYKKAFSLFSEAAEKGEPIAKMNLGIMYKNGWGVDKDIDKAIALHQEAAQKGYTPAKINLGLFYLNGDIVEKDYKKAEMLFKEASNDHQFRSKAIEQQERLERIKLSPELTEIRENILSKLKVNKTLQSTMTHYTSLSVGHDLLLEKSPLRLGHINAVNDPNEGKLLWRILGHDPIDANPVFIGCFLPDSDCLNMWRFYSKNHRNDDACGCAITYHVTNFFNYRLLNGKPEHQSKGKAASAFTNTGEYPQESASFYRVVYIGDDGNPVEHLSNELTEILNTLKIAVNDFLGEQPTGEKYQQLAKLLGPLPYLLKDADYKDEQEHRIIITHLEYGAKEIQYSAPDLDKNKPPRLYLELHRDKHLKPIKHVTLGPKSPYKEMMAPYWHHQLAMNFGSQLKGNHEFYIKASKCSYK